MAPRSPLQGILACLLLCSLLAAALPAVSGAPPPRPFCAACGDTFEATADYQGVAVTVDRSNATIHVHANGSATWVVRNRLVATNATDRLRANATLRRRVADRTMPGTLLDANVSAAGVLTMRSRDPAFAEGSVGGVLRTGAFTEAYGYRNLDGLGAERLVVVAPDGMRVGSTVPGASVSTDGRRMVLTEFSEGFVTFVPRGSVLTPVTSALAIVLLVAPALLTNLLVGLAFPTVLFGLCVAVIETVLARADAVLDVVRDYPGRVLAAAGVVLTVGALLASGGFSLLGGSGAPSFGAGLTFVVLGAALARRLDRGRVDERFVLVSAVAGVAVAAAITTAGAIAFQQNSLTRSLLDTLPVLVPVFALLPAGYALGKDDRRRAVGFAVGGFVVGTLWTTSLGALIAPPFGNGPLAVVVLVVVVLSTAAVGTPLLVVGRVLAQR
jgi:hypothetical protein